MLSVLSGPTVHKVVQLLMETKTAIACLGISWMRTQLIVQVKLDNNNNNIYICE